MTATQNSMIVVDRSVKPAYPIPSYCTIRIDHPELEDTGPAEYDIHTVVLWLHTNQKNGRPIEGSWLYAHLEKTDALKTCLGLRDLEEIQKKGIAFFRKYFQNKQVHGLRSALRNNDGGFHFRVPYLDVENDQVVILWRWLFNNWGDNCYTARFSGNQVA